MSNHLKKLLLNCGDRCFQQMLMVFGSQGYFAEIGQLGGTSDCFLVVTRGPFNSKMDLQEAGLEIHDVHSNASSIIWASEKVKDLQQEHPETCKHGVDLWIGEAL